MLTDYRPDPSEVVYLGFTRAALSAAFDRVKNAANWKMPIRARVDVVAEDVSIAAIDAACVFYAGCHVTVRQVGPTVLEITAPGYYAAVGA